MEWPDRSPEAEFRMRPTNNYRSQNIQVRKSSFVFKNKPAPLPPTSQHHFPKTGNYQPKILSESKSPTANSLFQQKPQENNNEHIFVNAIVRAPVEVKNNTPNPYIVGDKGVPLRNDSQTADSFVIPKPIPPPRRYRSSVKIVAQSEDLRRNNPLYDRSVSQRPDKVSFNLDVSLNNCDTGMLSGIGNPVFRSRETKDSSDGTVQNKVIKSTQVVNENHIKDYPYIPPPDYFEEEVTVDFADESNAVIQQTRNSVIYTEYEGEDFGKYLEDDQLEKLYDVQSQGHKHYETRHFSGATYHGRNRKRTGNHDKMSKQTDSRKIKNTIRNFTFLDSKIGWGGDKTVNSTSAKGRYMKRERDRKRIDTSGQFSSERGPGSYEDFLRVKNGISLESPNSSDSGVDISDDSQQMDMYLKSRPKQVRNGQQADRKPSIWRRLTWRFRKSVNISTDFQGERL